MNIGDVKLPPGWTWTQRSMLYARFSGPYNMTAKLALGARDSGTATLTVNGYHEGPWATYVHTADQVRMHLAAVTARKAAKVYAVPSQSTESSPEGCGEGNNIWKHRTLGKIMLRVNNVGYAVWRLFDAEGVHVADLMLAAYPTLASAKVEAERRLKPPEPTWTKVDDKLRWERGERWIDVVEKNGKLRWRYGLRDYNWSASIDVTLADVQQRADAIIVMEMP